MNKVLENIIKSFKGKIDLDRDEHNNRKFEIILDEPSDIIKFCSVCKRFYGRCIDINLSFVDKENIYLIYHFDIKNRLFNIKIKLKEQETCSISFLFESAFIWEEKLSKKYNILFTHTPFNHNVFLENIDNNEYIPLSTIMTQTVGEMSYEHK
jgi:hypothetical protein